jgi:Ca2+-binding EF-hand superfamily protein
MAQSGQRKVVDDIQLARYRRIFNMMDRNKNGVIEAKELAAMAHVMGYQFGKEGIMVKYISYNGHGFSFFVSYT